MGVVLGLSGCGSDGETATPDGSISDGSISGGVASAGDRLAIVVSTTILGDIVESAAGDSADVQVLMPVGADPHEFALSAKQAAAMERADLVVVNGRGLEGGMTDVIDAVAETTDVFVASDHVPTGDDPHIWMDPVQMIPVVEALQQELVALGADADLLSASVDAYVAELQALDDEIAQLVASIPESRRKLVTNHDAFEAFAARYGLEVVGTVIPSMTTSAEASASELESLAATIRETGLPALFAETTEPQRLADAVAAEVGEVDGRPVAVVELYTGSVGEPGSGADTYVGMLRVDATRIAEALR
jgi:zinc/manganese transport system substrate-binding protein